MLIWRIVLICDEEAEWIACVSVDPETSGRNKQSTQDYIQGKSQVKGKAHKNIENFNKKILKHQMRSSYQLLICTMYRLCCGYEWELFTLLVTMWLTLPRPFAGRFHGSSGAWNSALVVKAGLSVLKWEPWGMCASRRITAQRSCFFFFFWPWQQSGEHVPHCNECREAFL